MDNKNMLFIPNRKKRSYFRTSDVVFLVIVTCVVTFNMSFLFSIAKGTNFESSENSKYLNEFIKEYNRIVDNYYGDLDEDALIDGALEGLIDALPDDYSSTLDNSESNNYDTHLEGTYEGIGIEIVNDTDNNIIIYSIIENSPASKADLKVGDIVKSINGTSLEKTSTSDFVNMIKDDNKDFVIVVERDGKEITNTLRKGKITLQSVTSEIIEKNNKKIGYIGISIFAANSYSQFKQQLDTVESANIDGLIIDVRGNSGGYLSTVTEMLNLFIDSGDVIYQTEKNGKVTKIKSTMAGTKIYDIVVLIDGGSASASEILAASLSEQCGAKLVGKKTYGKGTVQELITLADGSQYKYTTKKWLTPKGNWIDGTGIAPDYEVGLDETYIQNPSQETDAQLQKALEFFNK